MLHGFSTEGLSRTLAQSAVPVALVSNGTVATNGIITLSTALPLTYSSGIWVRLPAGAVVGGLAGLYWVVMTSTTQGQVYAIFSDSASEFVPRIPTGALVAAVGSNAAYTQTTGADVTVFNVVLPGMSMGDNGSLRCHYSTSNNSSAGAKTSRVKHGTTTLGNMSMSATTSTGGVTGAYIRNRGVQSSQVGGSITQSASNPPTMAAVNTAVDGQLTVTLQLAVATDFSVLELCSFEILPG